MARQPKNGQRPDGDEAPDGAGMYLYWDGRKNYRTRMPAPRVLEPVKRYSFRSSDGNRVIEGDNLQVMVSLRSQYRSIVDIAYLDPPYNTGKGDFRYSDRRFHDPNADSGDAVYISNEDGGRHTKWLNYMGPRLWLTWELLADHGVCFVSISDVELFRLGLLMDEIFGEKNRLGVIVWKGAIDNNPTRIAVEHEYILCYAKHVESVPEQWTGISPAKEWLLNTYESLRPEYRGDLKKIEKAWRAAIKEQNARYRQAVEEGREADEIDLGRMARYRYIDHRGPWAKDWHLEKPYEGGYFYDLTHPVTKKPVKRPPRGYRYSPETMKQLLADDRIVFGKDEKEPAQLRRYLRDSATALRSVIHLAARAGSDELAKLIPGGADLFPHPKPVELITMLLGAAGDIDSLVLDPFAGSGTTGHAVMKLNSRDGGVRRFILVEEGTKEDPYCRTVLVPRLKAAIKAEKFDAGFAFEKTGTRLDRNAILELEREAISNLIVQTDVTGMGRGLTKLSGKYIIASNARRQGIALCWNGRSDSTITADVLKDMFEEASALKLHKPLRVYGSTCLVGETDSFQFCQIPDEILAALQLNEVPADLESGEEFAEHLETLETAAQLGAGK